ncbi:MAG: hypothetical protein WDO13_21615 [Verrucomicrobiota bacterium]
MKTKIFLLCLLVALIGLAAWVPASRFLLRHRIMTKIERVKEGMHTWAANGRDPSNIAQEMVRGCPKSRFG